ncbi:MAG: hypothetical protein NTW19_12465, partial [Planctomycetota bacterium]|nr:hypothetical protein [Planctomycetota bacterium]
GGADVSAEGWNRQIDAFDVPGLAAQVASTGCGYFFLTLGQNSGHFLAPNATYERLAGVTPGMCSRRDIVAELADALAPHGVRMMVYLPSGAPAADPVAMKNLGWEWGFEGGWPQAWGTRRTGRRLAEFQVKWEAVIREWSTRWGPKVHGWWIDGCYFADEMYRHADAPNFKSFAGAMRAGNPGSIVAFNPGVLTPIVCHSEEEDYTAGEIDRLFPAKIGPWVERNGHKAQCHILSYLGSSWCAGERPAFSDEFAIAYTRHVADHQGVITWDVPIQKSGLVPQPFVDQLRAIGGAMGRAPNGAMGKSGSPR